MFPITSSFTDLFGSDCIYSLWDIKHYSSDGWMKTSKGHMDLIDLIDRWCHTLLSTRGILKQWEEKRSNSSWNWKRNKGESFKLKQSAIVTSHCEVVIKHKVFWTFSLKGMLCSIMCIIGGFCKGLYLIGLKNTMILSLCHLMTAKAGESAVLVINTMCSADRAADIQYLPSLEGAARQVWRTVWRRCGEQSINQLTNAGLWRGLLWRTAPPSPENLRNVGKHWRPSLPHKTGMRPKPH